VAGNRIGFNRALLHVLGNAAEAVREVENPAVEIELIEPEQTPGAAFTTLIVRDNGRGIRRENMSKVFTPFFSTKEGRVGLGLSIARKVMTKMGGGIELFVRPEGGLEARIAILSFYDPAEYYETREGRC
jgi:C4-dicarboxylate-specific signal transduction histidine kinase